MSLQTITVIENNTWKYCACLLRDGRLALGGKNGIVIYSKYIYQMHVIIEDRYNAYSICGLRNGNLASSGEDKVIKIYEIDGSNFKLIYSFKGHRSRINKIIELEDGKLCSYSHDDKTVRIWDNNDGYKPIQTLRHIYNYILIEVNNYILYATQKNMRLLNKSTNENTIINKYIYAVSLFGISKLKENKVIIGGKSEFFILDILSFEITSFKNEQLLWIYSICVLREDKILLGNNHGEIICYDLLSSRIISIQKLHDDIIYCIVKSEDKIFSSSNDVTIISVDFG